MHRLWAPPVARTEPPPPVRRNVSPLSSTHKLTRGPFICSLRAAHHQCLTDRIHHHIYIVYEGSVLVHHQCATDRMQPHVCGYPQLRARRVTLLSRANLMKRECQVSGDQDVPDLLRAGQVYRRTVKHRPGASVQLPEPTLERGDTSSHVTRVQSRLFAHHTSRTYSLDDLRRN